MTSLIRKRNFISAILFALAAIPFCSAAFADPLDLSETEERAVKAQLSLKDCLTRESYQLADELGLIQHLTRLQALGEHSKHKQGQPLSPESTALRMELTEVVLETMLQCQATIAEIESEFSLGLEVRAALEGKRDAAVRTNSVANVVANGFVSGFGALFQMPFETAPDPRYELPGEVVEAAGSLLSGGLGGLALHQSNGIGLSHPIKPTMLAKVFKRPNDSNSEYPDVIWRYLNAAPPGSEKGGPSRRELLIQRWQALGRIPPQSTQKGRLYVRALAGTVPLNKTMTISMLTDRAAMLVDLRAEVSLIYKELLNMMLVVRAL